MPRRVARRLRRALGRRGAFLLCFGMVWGLIGYGQLVSPQPDQRGLRLLLNRVPLEVWGWLWIVAGVAAVASAFLPQGSDRFGFAALSLMVTPWIVSYLVAWGQGNFPRGWIASALYGGLAIGIMVVAGWSEPPRPKREEPPYDS
ncbi:hypothetical protein AB0C88_37510 [Streptomyces chartreusis]|uniref:hypothetical protein n=1 Tax=Streptomyces chartreusis TaxID=1969 RepID=UPI0033FF3227